MMIVFFINKYRIKKIADLNIFYDNILIKHHSSVFYLSCDFKVWSVYSIKSIKIELSQCFTSCIKNDVMAFSPPHLLYNTPTKLCLERLCWAWYPKLIKELNRKLQISQNKCIRFAWDWVIGFSFYTKSYLNLIGCLFTKDLISTSFSLFYLPQREMSWRCR